MKNIKLLKIITFEFNHYSHIRYSHLFAGYIKKTRKHKI